MSTIPATLHYAPTHEWVRTEADGSLSIGITDHAQDALGDIVFLELPAVGRRLEAGEACALVESVKTASDIHAPFAGEIIEINGAAANAPESVNEAPYETWLFRLRPDSAELSELLDAAAYAKSIDA